MKLKDYLKKHPQTITLYISEISELPFNGRQKIYRMKLSKPLDTVHGSIGFDYESANEVFIAEETVSYVKTFRVGNYNNFKLVLVNLYLDVSIPHIVQRDGHVIDKPSRVWIVHETLHSRRLKMRDNYSQAAAKLFNNGK